MGQLGKNTLSDCTPALGNSHIKGKRPATKRHLCVEGGGGGHSLAAGE